MAVTRPTVGVLDTSVLIAYEAVRPVNRELLPDSALVSVITIGELRAGVLAATDVAVQAARMRTLESALRIGRLPVDDQVASAWAALRVQLARAGRRVNVNDLWIAATAAAHRLPVYTQDDDFDPIADTGAVDVVKL